MKTNLRNSLVCLVLGLGLPAMAQVSTVISTAADVQVTTSYVSAHENLSAVNDGRIGTSSTNRPSGGIYGNWNTPNTYNWVAYEFPDNMIITTASVYWFTDNGGLLIPTQAYIECLDPETNTWVKQNNIGTTSNAYNTLPLSNVLTNKIRVVMFHPQQSTGIVEFRVLGYKPAKTEFVSHFSQLNDDAPKEGVNYLSIAEGESVSFSVRINPESTQQEGTWRWTGPNNFTSSDSCLTLTGVTPMEAGTYTVSFTNTVFGTTHQAFRLSVYDGEIGAPYAWKPYTPTLDYDFRKEYDDIPEPTKDLEEFPVAGRRSSGWWTYAWGNKARSLGTDKVGLQGIDAMLARMNKDFAYFREVMGWPPDLRARHGYRSTIYLYGSGLPTDNADSTALGGWQGATTYNGISYPMVHISYYPVYSFHPKSTYSDKAYQTGAVVHEGIHALLADLPGCKGSAWIQEGGNTWLQQEYEARISNDYSSMGFLNAPALLAPFMPIECYSGWLLDGSFGGPAAEGVNLFENGQQVCTWRNLLGGTQYGNLFVVYLGQTLGDRVVPWIWRNCPNRVLEGMADSLGSDQIRRLITEYRAKQAMLDFGKWTNATKALLNANLNAKCEQEWSPYWIKVDPWNMTPYTKTTMENDVIIPEERTLPGWSGANQVPIHIGTTATQVVVDFQPIGDNMTLQFCYRTKAGNIVYGMPVSQGECVLNIPLSAADRPANNVIIAVVTNTDYIYKGDETRKAKFDYRIKLLKGAYHSASPSLKWYEYTQTIRDNSFTDIANVYDTPALEVALVQNVLSAGAEAQVFFNREPELPVELLLTGMNGDVVGSWTVHKDGNISLPANLSRGVYLLSVNHSESKSVVKVIVR